MSVIHVREAIHYNNFGLGGGRPGSQSTGWGRPPRVPEYGMGGGCQGSQEALYGAQYGLNGA